MGRDLLGQLQHRSASAAVPKNISDTVLGWHFPLLGYRSLMLQLLPELFRMVYNHRELRRTPAEYIRAQHILQLAAAPGMGKSTAAIAMWAALHHVCTQHALLSQWLPGFTVETSELGAELIKRSFSPQTFLVFRLSFCFFEGALGQQGLMHRNEVAQPSHAPV